MKIEPQLFAPAAPSPQTSAPQVSQARLAFEAMLSANSQRQIVRPAPQANTTINGAINRADSAKREGDEPLGILARPGRVLDIKV